MSLEEEYIKRVFSKKSYIKVLEGKFDDVYFTDKELNRFLTTVLPSTIRLIQLKARQLEEGQKTQVDSNFQLDIIERFDHITLVLEEFLNTNKEIINKLDNINNNYLNSTNKKEEESLIEIQDLPDETIERLIFDYLEKKKKKEVFPSDIAISFNLDAKKVFDICQRLKKEGKLV